MSGSDTGRPRLEEENVEVGLRTWRKLLLLLLLLPVSKQLSMLSSYCNTIFTSSPRRHVYPPRLAVRQRVGDDRLNTPLYPTPSAAHSNKLQLLNDSRREQLTFVSG